jgi:hypothetical protein
MELKHFIQDRFPAFVIDFMVKYHPYGTVPQWIVEALATVNITLPPSAVEKRMASTSLQ